MVELAVRDGKLVVEVLGWHVLWALKRRIEVPVGCVRSVARDPDAARGGWIGWRVPGTYLPGVIVAGTYYKDGERHFYDVSRFDRTVVIRLEGCRWHRIVVDVADPDAAVARIERTLSEREET